MGKKKKNGRKGKKKNSSRPNNSTRSQKPKNSTGKAKSSGTAGSSGSSSRKNKNRYEKKKDDLKTRIREDDAAVKAAAVASAAERPAPAEKPAPNTPAERPAHAEKPVPSTPAERPAPAKKPVPSTPAAQPATAATAAPGRLKLPQKTAVLSAAILPFILFFHEMVFRAMTVRNVFRYALIPTILFCVIYGLIGYLLSGISRNSKVNRAVKSLLIFFSAVVFGVEYFVYRQFKVFYDVRTVKGGASGVVTSFADHALKLILTPTGILTIVLLFAPLILYRVFGRRIDPAVQSGAKERIAVAGVIAVAIAINAVAINAVEMYKYSYSERYNFGTAVENFGFMTALRLDVTRSINGAAGATYDLDPGAAEGAEGELPEFVHTSVSTVTRSASQGKLVYDKNVMDIDFDGLGASAGGALQAMDNYVKSQEPSSQNEMTGRFAGKNLIFISAEAFSAEAIDPERTPTLYRMATKGINFTDYYQPASAGTTGGEFQNIFGMLPMYGGASMGEMTGNNCYLTMSYQLNALGYYGMAFHNNDYTYYSRNITHNKLGYSEGYYGVGNGLEGYITEQWPESDLEMMEATVDMYIEHQPFDIYYMSVSGHSLYSRDGNAMSKKNWASVEGREGSERVNAYLACNVELENAMKYLLERLEEAGIADDTVIVISADHFPYGLDDDGTLGDLPYLSELYGYNVTDLMQRDHNRLIIWSGCLEDEEPLIVDTPTFSLDILPTLLNLYGVQWDSRVLVGRDVFSNKDALVFNMNHDWKTEMGTYTAGTDTFTPADDSVTVSPDYVGRMNSIVTNKINYCSDVITYDYYAHLFG